MGSREAVGREEAPNARLELLAPPQPHTNITDHHSPKPNSSNAPATAELVVPVAGQRVAGQMGRQASVVGGEELTNNASCPICTAAGRYRQRAHAPHVPAPPTAPLPQLTEVDAHNLCKVRGGGGNGSGWQGMDCQEAVTRSGWAVRHMQASRSLQEEAAGSIQECTEAPGTHMPCTAGAGTCRLQAQPGSTPAADRLPAAAAPLPAAGLGRAAGPQLVRAHITPAGTRVQGPVGAGNPHHQAGWRHHSRLLQCLECTRY